MVKAKSKKKIIKMKACPCPDHTGKKLPATPEYWHKGGNPDGFQGYCKTWRNKIQNAKNKAARKAIKLRKPKSRKGKRISTSPKKKESTIRIKQKTFALTVINPKLKALPAIQICKQCEEEKPYQHKFWQMDRGRFRQPCKACIAKKRAERKKKLIETPT